MVKKQPRALKRYGVSLKGRRKSIMITGLGTWFSRERTVKRAILWRPNTMNAMVRTVQPNPILLTRRSNMILKPSSQY